MGAIPPAAVQVPLKFQLAAVEHDVVVIGAGLSGLEAARNIHRAGLSILFLRLIRSSDEDHCRVRNKLLGQSYDSKTMLINITLHHTL
jgi:predicted oxidoreductase